MLPYEMNTFCCVMLFLLCFYIYWTVPLGEKLSAVMNLPDFFPNSVPYVLVACHTLRGHHT